MQPRRSQWLGIAVNTLKFRLLSRMQFVVPNCNYRVLTIAMIANSHSMVEKRTTSEIKVPHSPLGTSNTND